MKEMFGVRLLGLFMGAGIISCAQLTDPAQEPPGEATVGTRGKEIVKKAVFCAKTLRTVHDIKQVIDRFEFDQTVIDSPAISVSFWMPEPAGELVSTGFAKKREYFNTNMRAIQTAMNKSAGQVLKTASIPSLPDSINYDSLYALDSSRLAFALTSDTAAEAPWDSLRDSIIGGWDITLLDTLPVFTGLLRCRFADSGSTRIKDTEQWTVAGDGTMSLGGKRQAFVTGSDTVYYHAARLTGNAGEILFDTLMIEWGDSTRHMYLQRRDESSVWWNTFDSTLYLAGFRDSVVDNTGWSRTVLDDEVIKRGAGDSSAQV
ncbi:MAG: hypothetical protein GF350_02460, partial [Chitinivibrionales bacterium]|nr:hypothetical protein [Chitinivibrionales bacterium]